MTFKVSHIILILCLQTYVFSNAQQDSVALDYIAQKNIEDLRNEQKEINFQNFFFNALQQRAIGNFDKAVSSLEQCQNIKTDDKAVQFEFGKNYFDLEKYIEAADYTEKALIKDPDNLFILKLLKSIYSKQSLFNKALEIQKKIASFDENEQLDLVLLYIKNNQINEARQLLLDLEKKGTLSANLIPFKESLLKGTVINSEIDVKTMPLEDQSIEDLRQAFMDKKEFKVLKMLMIKLNNKKQFIELENDSKEGIELFPAQPFVYLMHGGALNQMKNYQLGLNSLLLGLDYLIDDPQMEADFYEQLSLSYKGLGQNSEASKLYNKAIALRQKKL